jgi:putative component of membrane protein insertase Oxa1/YidC/SpoIIIJ protein YidD
VRFILIAVVRIYWKLIPPDKRRPCIFRESCSKHVYRISKEKGFWGGIQALVKRFVKCRPGYKVYMNADNTFEVHLNNGSIIKGKEISEELLPPLNYNYINRSIPHCS